MKFYIETSTPVFAYTDYGANKGNLAITAIVYN